MKMYCIYNKEAIQLMHGSRGKMAAQAGHAYLHAFWDAEKKFPDDAAAYRATMTRKIALIVEDAEKLTELLEAYRSVCGTTKVVDAGFTVFKEPTFTCIGIGPIDDDKIGDDLRELKVFT